MPLTLREDDDPEGPDAVTAATVAWLTFGGGERPRGFETRPGWSALIWSHEMWNWGESELVQKYSQHRETVDALARAAGVEPWCVGAIARERDRQRRSADGTDRA